jgi:hypothetical protein
MLGPSRYARIFLAFPSLNPKLVLRLNSMKTFPPFSSLPFDLRLLLCPVGEAPYVRPLSL